MVGSVLYDGIVLERRGEWYNMIMTTIITFEAKKYFWGDDLNELNWEKHSQYIIQTLLDKGDSASVTWLFEQIPSQEVLKMLPSLTLSSQTRNFWEIYLS